MADGGARVFSGGGERCVTCPGGVLVNVVPSGEIVFKDAPASFMKIALRDVLSAFSYPDNELRLNEARDNAGNDMLKMMQIVFPIATKIQMGVIQKHGFSPDGDGLIRFSQMIKVYEKQDEDLAELNTKLRAIMMPPVTAHMPSQNSAV